MSVAVAHQASSTSSQIALREAGREASLRRTSLTVLHVVETLDRDVEEAFRRSVDDQVSRALAGVGLADLPWTIELSTAGDDVAEAILELATTAGAQLLVIGARRRSPVGKFLLGSLTQTLILESEIPVMVVKSER